MSEPVRDDTEMSDDETHPTDAPDEGDGSALPPPTSVESLVGALLEAGPEVAEHVVRAAQELLLAAQAIVDAADKAVREQQDLRTTRAEPDDAGTDAPVRRLDLAE
jgi:hypothetical protein